MYYPKSASAFLSLLAEQESPHFSELVFIFRQYVIALSPIMNPNESDLNDVLMPSSLSDDKIIKHMAQDPQTVCKK